MYGKGFSEQCANDVLIMQIGGGGFPQSRISGKADLRGDTVTPENAC